MNEVFIEKRKRGFFGWVFLLIFILWNILMLLWLISYGSTVGTMEVSSAAEQAGRNIGATIGVGMILFTWAIGSIITGLLALLTRGSKTIVRKV